MRFRAIAPAIAIVLLGIASLGMQLWVQSGVPSDDEWRVVAREIQGRVQAGDLILLDPAWAERGRVFLRGAPVEAWPRVDADDLVRARRVWRVALRRAPHATSLEGDLLAAGAKRVFAGRFGALALSLHETAPRALGWDFTERLADAVVTMGAAVCPRDGRGRHVCSGAGWNYVGAGDYEIDYTARRCVWAHPVGARDNPVTITWKGAALGRWIQIRAGLVAGTALDANAPPVVVQVRVDGTELGEVAVASRPGFRSFAVDTSRAAGGPHEVAFLVSAENPSYRQLCFDAWAE